MPTLLLREKDMLESRSRNGDENPVLGICSESPMETFKALFGKYSISEYKSRRLGIEYDDSTKNGLIFIRNQDPGIDFPPITKVMQGLKPYENPREYTQDERQALVMSCSRDLLRFTYSHRAIGFVQGKGPRLYGHKPNGIFNYLAERAEKQDPRLENILQETLEIQEALLGTGDADYLMRLFKPRISEMKSRIRKAKK